MRLLLKLIGISLPTALVLAIVAKAIDFKDFKKKHLKQKKEK